MDKREYKGRIVKKTRRDGKGVMLSIPSGEGNFVDTWFTINDKTVLPEGVTDVNELFGKKIDVEVRAGFLNKATFSDSE